ncbi:MAG: UbiA family prenyltransferase [Thermostichales cyanobacterium GMQP_bins_62]
MGCSPPAPASRASTRSGSASLLATWVLVCSLFLLIGLAFFLGYFFVGGPFVWGYLGLGVHICFFCFGPLGIQAAYYSQTQAWTWQSLPLGTVIGLTTTLILFCSHFHQVDDDLAAGKRSPVVRLGSRRAAALIPYACGLIYGLTVVFVGMGWLPWLSLGILVTLPLAYRLSQLLLSSYDQYARISHSKFVAVQLHFWSGMILCLSLVLA